MSKEFDNVIELFDKAIVTPGRHTHVIPVTDILTYLLHTVLVSGDRGGSLAGYICLASQLGGENIEVTQELKELMDAVDTDELLEFLPSEYIW
ncbi:MAG: hypothetical protein U9Q19_05455 [Pseudomonadota bacterium]|nr:hypothetical protein [Pseudomonadota bacterium]